MKSNIYTGTGDEGTTALIGGLRVKKTDKRIEAYGTIDELNSFIGLLLSKVDYDEEYQKTLLAIQHKLFALGGYLATDPSHVSLKEGCVIKDKDVEFLEKCIDTIDETLPKLHNFILPNGNEASSLAHVCRSICRRAERNILALSPGENLRISVVAYVNRLSDYFFVLARKINQDTGIEDTSWEK